MGKQDNRTALGVTENVAALLCYVLGWLSGLIILLIEKENRFVRFHAMQSLVTFLALAVVAFAVHGPLAVAAFPALRLFFYLLAIANALLSTFLWVLLMIKAWQGEKYRLPLAGDFAESLLRGREG